MLISIVYCTHKGLVSIVVSTKWFLSLSRSDDCFWTQALKEKVEGRPRLERNTLVREPSHGPGTKLPRGGLLPPSSTRTQPQTAALSEASEAAHSLIEPAAAPVAAGAVRRVPMRPRTLQSGLSLSLSGKAPPGVTASERDDASSVYSAQSLQSTQSESHIMSLRHASVPMRGSRILKPYNPVIHDRHDAHTDSVEFAANRFSGARGSARMEPAKTTSLAWSGNTSVSVDGATRSQKHPSVPGAVLRSISSVSSFGMEAHVGAGSRSPGPGVPTIVSALQGRGGVKHEVSLADVISQASTDWRPGKQQHMFESVAITGDYIDSSSQLMRRSLSNRLR